MPGENPFSQWAYPAPGQVAAEARDNNLLSPSIYGALPSGPSNYGLPLGYLPTSPSGGPANQAPNANLQVTTFHFTSPTNALLNSNVVGPQGQKYFSVATHGVGHTIIINEQAGSTRGEAVGKIEWQAQSPFVSLAGAVAHQPAGQWLHWTGDRRFRAMSARGREYRWMFNTGMFFVCCYTAGGTASEFVARIVKGNGTDGVIVSLEITAPAVQAGLLDVCILAAVLFTSGRNLD
ncbi:hypothetical protein FA13DRAFT_1698179 [Coprinellus micaceus]|uniref:DUF6593 domain-containing protein n=1 Tax=Coprinellus micaceus TaxID=71717 RepID=A0A4Y7SBZ2_COPMI|nr:hypothetical protein FA13DRAFT_1698179 [Coprinellus micaceus]